LPALKNIDVASKAEPALQEDGAQALLIQTMKDKRLASCKCGRSGTVEDWKKVCSTMKAILS
jgi:hypothetical protein